MRRGRHRGRGILLVWAVWWCALVPEAQAQQKPCDPTLDAAQAGTLRGTVRDPSLRPIAGVEVSVEGSVTCRAITDNQGVYRIERIPPGRYDVVVDRRGFKTPSTPSVDVKANSDQVRNFDLEDRPPAKEARFWGGLNTHAMDEFNQLLAVDRNEPIEWGFSAGAEVSVAATNVRFAGALHLPIGIEYLAASSTTTHSSAAGSATVIWDLPVVGLFVAPTLSVGSAERFYIHPAVGYYFLGLFQEAGLSVTDRSGRLAAKDAAPGVFAAIGLNQRMGDRAGLFVESGYRYLKFTSVELTPRGDFPPVLGGTLAAPLDYSGFVFRLGFSLRLSGDK
ncbi:MAG TPA: carboxypeptidase-like regulatory domain-containing protein [Vicinamibacterales bacterium]|nr:carboxypeptidase-like regulatory domain-containing protein [Vicinamibacterales bacterium]